MRSRRTTVMWTLIAISSVATRAFAEPAATHIRLGDKFLGSVAGEEDRITFGVIEGESVKITLESDEKFFVPKMVVSLPGMPDLSILVDNDKKSTGWIVATQSGLGSARVTSVAGSGPYQMSTKSKLPTALLKPPSIPGAGGQPTRSLFWARAGSTLKATIKPSPDGSTQPGTPTLSVTTVKPAGSATVPLGPYTSFVNGGLTAKVKQAPLLEFGLYELTAVPDGSGTAPLEMAVKWTPPPKQTWYEPGAGFLNTKHMIRDLSLFGPLAGGTLYSGHFAWVSVEIKSSEELDLPITYYLVHKGDFDDGKNPPRTHIIAETMIQAEKGVSHYDSTVAIPYELDVADDWMLMVAADPLNQTEVKAKKKGLNGDLWVDVHVDPMYRNTPDFAFADGALEDDVIELVPDDVGVSSGAFPGEAAFPDRPNYHLAAEVTLVNSGPASTGIPVTAFLDDLQNLGQGSSFAGTQQLDIWDEQSSSYVKTLVVNGPVASGIPYHMRVQVALPANLLSALIGTGQIFDATFRIEVNGAGAIAEFENGNLEYEYSDDNGLEGDVTLVPEGVDAGATSAVAGGPQLIQKYFDKAFSLPWIPSGTGWSDNPKVKHFAVGGIEGLAQGYKTQDGGYGRVDARGYGTLWPDINEGTWIILDSCAEVAVNPADLSTPFRAEFGLYLDGTNAGVPIIRETLIHVVLPDDLPNPGDFNFSDSWMYCADFGTNFNKAFGKNTSKPSAAGVALKLTFEFELCASLELEVSGVQDLSSMPASANASLTMGYETRQWMTFTLGVGIALAKGIIYLGGEGVITIFDNRVRHNNLFSVAAHSCPRHRSRPSRRSRCSTICPSGPVP